MARLRRQPYTAPIPEGAEIVTHKGKPHARFRGRDGKPVLAPLTADGRRCRLLSRKWYGEYRDENNALRCVPLSTDKTAAGQMLAELVRKAERKRGNLADPFEDHRKRPLTEHLDDYRRFLEAEGNCADYVAKTVARVRAVLDGCGFLFVNDLAPEKVAEFLHRLRRDPPRPELPPGQAEFTPRELVRALGGVRPPRLARVLRREGLATLGNGKARRYPRPTVEALQELLLRGIGISTSNGYLTAVKGFSRWLYEKERTDRDRLVSLSRLNPKTDLRHERRALPEKQLQELLAAAGAAAGEFQGLTGRDRMMLYATAMATGFRASELTSLTPSSFDLQADPPTATVRAAYSKNRRQAVQPLPPDIAEGLRGYLADRPPDRPVWPGNWHKDAAEMLRADLAAAGIPYRDADGRVCDFHALRHSYITLLERSGVSPKMAQELARHSDIRLTMNVYTHARLHDLAGAVGDLPPLLPTGRGAEAPAAAATGTDGRPGGDSLPIPYRAPDAGCGRVRAGEGATGPGAGPEPPVQILTLHGDDGTCGDVSPNEGELPGQDSNLDKENQNHISHYSRVSARCYWSRKTKPLKCFRLSASA